VNACPWVSAVAAGLIGGAITVTGLLVTETFLHGGSWDPRCMASWPGYIEHVTYGKGNKVHVSCEYSPEEAL
jgi:hypothetical protein